MANRVFLFWMHVFLTVCHGKHWSFLDITHSTGFVPTVFRKLGLFPSSDVVVARKKKLILVSGQQDTRETRKMRRSSTNNIIFSYMGWLNWFMCCTDKGISRSDQGRRAAQTRAFHEATKGDVLHRQGHFTKRPREVCCTDKGISRSDQGRCAAQTRAFHEATKGDVPTLGWFIGLTVKAMRTVVRNVQSNTSIYC
jgi:hypothetical protein